MSKNRYFLYQPSPLNIIINWSWTLVILLLGIIFWLEVTHYQWITSFFFILFVWVTFSQIKFRKITIKNNKIIIGRVINPRWIIADLNHVKVEKMKHNSILININNRVVNLIMSSNSIIELSTIIAKGEI